MVAQQWPPTFSGIHSGIPARAETAIIASCSDNFRSRPGVRPNMRVDASGENNSDQILLLLAQIVCVLPRKIVVSGRCRPGSDCEVTWWQRIDQTIGDV
jgi:hypothetical protein